MKLNDFKRGMNHIDDELIEEALDQKGKKKRFYLPPSLVAGILAVLLIGTCGRLFLMQEGRSGAARDMAGEASEEAAQTQESAEGAKPEEAEPASEEAAVETAEAGSADGGAAAAIGDEYIAASDYGMVYDWLQDMFPEDLDNVTYGADQEKREMEAAEDSAFAGEAGYSRAQKESGDYSRTNLMTENVDESDIVKTDGDYIYMVQSGSVRITDIREGAPGDSQVLAPPFEEPSDRIREIYVDGDLLTILTSHMDTGSLTDGDSADDYAIRDYKQGVCDETIVYIYDITQPLNPKLKGTMRQDGAYDTSRKVGDILYLFTDVYLQRPQESREKAVSEEGLSEWVPLVNGSPVAADCIYLPEEGYYGIVMSSVNLNDPENTIDSRMVVTEYNQIYVSSQAIYLYHDYWTGNELLTRIACMKFSPRGSFTPGASTSVLGSVTDEFAINEKGGYLRILTTDYSGSTTVNTLFVLDGDLKQAGRIDEIARGEEIYAARFVGDLAYFITYKNVDPLFVADLSDPTAPELLGELEVTGFSEYLHLWDENHLLGIGYETDENSNRLGIKLVMFDISDPSELKAENSIVLKGEDYSAALSGEYKAILADPGKNLIGLASEDYTDGDKATYYLFSYDSDKGFTGLLESELPYADTSGYRGVYSGDWFYIAGNGDLKAFELE